MPYPQIGQTLTGQAIPTPVLPVTATTGTSSNLSSLVSTAGIVSGCLPGRMATRIGQVTTSLDVGASLAQGDLPGALMNSAGFFPGPAGMLVALNQTMIPTPMAWGRDGVPPATRKCGQHSSTILESLRLHTGFSIEQ